MTHYPACRRAVVLFLTSAAIFLPACVSENHLSAERRGMFASGVTAPEGLLFDESAPAPGPQKGGPQQAADLTPEGAVARGSCEPTIYDTRTVFPQIQPIENAGAGRRVRDMVPPHDKLPPLPQGPVNDLPVGGLTAKTRSIPGATWPAISATQWIPPDPTLAVGPSHVVATVNSRVAFFTKAGMEQFAVDLGSAGNPGFFETVGAGSFVFDPKCFYDHLAQRFVIVGLEVYGAAQTAWMDIAVSDDTDPNGVWYKYRTDAVITVDSETFWWDYPGFGYDADAYYVNGNLVGLNPWGGGGGPYAGTGFRIFSKAAMLSGGTASYATLRDGNARSVQAAQHFGSNQAAFFVSTESSSSLKVHAIRDPITAPTLAVTSVTVPSHNGPTQAPNYGGWLNTLDDRVFNAHWRNGRLYTTHGASVGTRNVARWYQLNTNNWPTSGTVSLEMSGNADGGTGVHCIFPAIYSNRFNDVGIVVGRTTLTSTPAVAVTGRRATDAPGTMGPLTVQYMGGAPGNGRWGDYYGIAVDPVNDSRFWCIGEYQGVNGWGTWVGSFLISCPVDFNGDGFVSGIDFDQFVLAFEAGKVEADFDRDGFVTGLDFDQYVQAFEAGC